MNSAKPPAASKKPPPADRSPSGTHPAVVGFRKKLESVAEVGVDLASLNREMKRYLEEVRTPIPPPPPSDPTPTPTPTPT